VFVACVSCLIVEPSPPSKTSFAVILNNNKIILNYEKGVVGSAQTKFFP
jgi:hypothetical protein